MIDKAALVINHQMGSNGCRREYYYEDSSSTESEWLDEDSEGEDDNSSSDGDDEEDSVDSVDEDLKSELKREAQELLDQSQQPARPIANAAANTIAASQPVTTATNTSRPQVKVKGETKAGVSISKQRQKVKRDVKAEDADGDTSDSTFLPDFSDSDDNSSDDESTEEEDDDDKEDEDEVDEVDEPTPAPTQVPTQQQQQGPCCGRCKAALPPPPPTDQPKDPKCDCCKVSFAPNVRSKTRPGRAVFRTHLCGSCLPNATAVLTRLAKFSRPSHLMCTGCKVMLAITAFTEKQQWYRYRKKCGPRFCIMCLSSDFVRLGSRIAAKVVTCFKCNKTLPRTRFSASQQKLRSDEVDFPGKTYSCRACNTSGGTPAQILYCGACSQELPRSLFTKSQRKVMSKYDPNGNTAPPVLTCKSCQQKQTENSMLECAHCKKTLRAEAFPKAQRKKTSRQLKGSSHAVQPERYCKICWPLVTSDNSSVKIDCSCCSKSLFASAFSQKEREIALRGHQHGPCINCRAKRLAAWRQQSGPPTQGGTSTATVKTDPSSNHKSEQSVKADSSRLQKNEQIVKSDSSRLQKNEQIVKSDSPQMHKSEDIVKAVPSRKRDREEDSDDEVVFLRVVGIKRQTSSSEIKIKQPL